MKSTVTASLLLLMAALCWAQPAKPGEQALNADDVLNAYAQRVHAEVLPRAGELQPEEAFQLAGRIAAEVLAPHKHLLYAKAKADLAKLPKCTLDLTTGWETVEEMGGGVVRGEFAAGRWRSASQPASGAADKDSILLLSCWNPAAVAYVLRTQMLVRQAAPQEYARRAMIEALARPLLCAVHADPQAPVLAIQTGADVFVISLQYADEGYYVDTRVRWLRKRAASSQPARAAQAADPRQADPRQKLAADYFEALTAADVDKVDEMTAVPYSLDRRKILTTREEVQAMHQKVAASKGKRDIPQYTVEPTDQAPELDKAQFPRYVVYRIAISIPGRQEKGNIDIYVTDSDTPKVIGFSD